MGGLSILDNNNCLLPGTHTIANGNRVEKECVGCHEKKKKNNGGTDWAHTPTHEQKQYWAFVMRHNAADNNKISLKYIHCCPTLPHKHTQNMLCPFFIARPRSKNKEGKGRDPKGAKAHLCMQLEQGVLIGCALFTV